jgi:hypothetical protein
MIYSEKEAKIYGSVVMVLLSGLLGLLGYTIAGDISGAIAVVFIAAGIISIFGTILTFIEDEVFPATVFIVLSFAVASIVSAIAFFLGVTDLVAVFIATFAISFSSAFAVLLALFWIDFVTDYWYNLREEGIKKLHS